MRWTALTTLAILSAACTASGPPAVSNSARPEKEPRIGTLEKQRDAVVRFFRPMSVQVGDWLESQKEPGETFEEYIDSDPTLPTPSRRTIYIQPIGSFTAEQRRAIRLTADYMKAFYDLPVKLNPDRQLGTVPADMKRDTGYPRKTQVRAQYFLDDVLPKLLRDDAAALIAFTNYDLYPGDSWAFVFGQASLQDRVGVWSLARLSSMTGGNSNALLDRTLKIAIHETGHMFSMKHCTKFECLMSGTNHLAETDRRPLDVCPECMAKIAWAFGYDPAVRYRRLADFWRSQKRDGEAQLAEQKRMAVLVAQK